MRAKHRTCVCLHRQLLALPVAWSGGRVQGISCGVQSSISTSPAERFWLW